MNKITFSLFLILTSTSVFTQDLTKSPYSALGLGDLQFGGNAFLSAIGQTCQGIRKSTDINSQNPSTYGNLKYTVVEASYKYTTGIIENSSASNVIDNYSFGYLNVGIPLSQKHHWGMAFGLQPYSSVGYNVSSNVNYPVPGTTLTTSGRGGLSKFYLGTGIALFRDLSIGVNASYLWGQLQSVKQIVIPPDYNMYNTEEQKTTYIGDIIFDYGIQYHKTFYDKKKQPVYQFVLGSTVNLTTSLSATQDFTAWTLGVGGINSVKDTVVSNNGVGGKIIIPAIYKFGFSFEKIDQWLICADVNYADWSMYRFFGTTDSLKKTMGGSIGATFIPSKPGDLVPYFKKIEYRLGVRYDNGYLNANGYDISMLGFSFGAGFPIARFKSKLNITGEYFVRGTTSNDLIRETYFRIILGVTFNDKWFDRYKYR